MLFPIRVRIKIPTMKQNAMTTKNEIIWATISLQSANILDMIPAIGCSKLLTKPIKKFTKKTKMAIGSITTSPPISVVVKKFFIRRN